ncbi:hypothetical protein [Nocardioides sp.]|nr:hypothetical protein [Nocardioides sp.]MBJ7356075.1 hypothetical protein [Nocardioides sp.]
MTITERNQRHRRRALAPFKRAVRPSTEFGAPTRPRREANPVWVRMSS